MNCGAVERWLNEGMPGRGAGAMRLHAARCPLCGPRLAAAERVEALLAASSHAAPRAPAGFAGRLMARIEADHPVRPPGETATARGRQPVGPAHTARWWLRAGADPAIPLAIALATVFLGVTQASVLILGRLPSLPPPDWGAARGALGGTPFTQTVVGLCALAFVLFASHRLLQLAQGSRRVRWRQW